MVDASILSAMFLKEEGVEAIRAVVESHPKLYAPSFWKFEISNAIWKKKDIPLKTALEVINILWNFPIYNKDTKEWFVESFKIAKEHGIAFYDASYISMAKILDLPLWTRDKLQARIAANIGVFLWKSENMDN